MPIEMYGPDADGMLALMPESPDPDAPTPESRPAPEPAPEPAPTPEPKPADDLTALRRMVEAREARDREREVKDAQRDTQVATMERLLRGEELTPPVDAKPQPPVEPKAENFDDHESYVRAAARFEAKQEVEAERTTRQKEEQARSARAQMIERDQSVKQAEDAFVADHPDYVDVVTRGLVAKAPPEFRQLLMLVDEAPAVAYQVAQDEALLGRLMAMPPGPLFYALGRLSAAAGGGGVASTPPPTATTPSTLSAPAGVGGSGRIPPVAATVPPAGRPKPAPPRPLGGSGAGVPSGYDDSMSQAEYRAYRKAGGL